MCNELATTSIPRPPVLLGETRYLKSGVKLSLGSREVCVGRFSRLGFIPHYPTVI